MNVAIIPAAGSGQRMRTRVPKALLSIDGVPLLIQTLRAMDRAPLVDAVIVVAPADFLAASRALIAEFKIRKVSRVVKGGAERQDSVFAGLKAARQWLEHRTPRPAGRTPHLIIVHDAARALIEPSEIERVIKAARRTGAAILAAESRDTLKEVSRRRVITTLDRAKIWQAQTPQVFDSELLWRAYVQARRAGINATDDSALVERLGARVAVVAARGTNLKITYPQEIVIAEAILREKMLPRSEPRTTSPRRAHRDAEGNLTAEGAEVRRGRERLS